MSTPAETGPATHLRRSLSLLDLLVYGLVFIVPIAPFVIFGVVFNASKGMVPLTYLIGLVAIKGRPARYVLERLRGDGGEYAVEVVVSVE